MNVDCRATALLRCAVKLVAFVVASYCQPVLALPNYWTPVGPEGGHVMTIAVEEANPSNVYAGTQEAGVFMSADSGMRWSATGGLRGQLVRELIIDQRNPTVLYARAARSPEGVGLYKSVDRGRTWVSITIEGGVRGQTSALVIDPSVSTTLYAGLYGSGVYRSVDGGSTWKSLNTGLTDGAVRVLAIDRLDPETLYAGTFRGLFKTTDAGATWWPLNAGLPGPGNLNVLSFAIAPDSEGTMYVGTERGFFVSTDAGEHWTPADADLPKPSLVPAIAFDRLSPDVVYVVAPGSCPEFFCIGTVYKSVDRGGHWTALEIAEPFDFVEALAVGADNALYAGTTYGGVFTSTDSGSSWRAISSGLRAARIQSLVSLPGSPSTIYAATFGGLFQSAGGESWHRSDVALGDPRFYLLVAVPPKTLYVVVSGRFFVSVDAGERWDEAEFVPGLTVLAGDPMTPTTVFAGTYDDGVFKSTDGGAEWVSMSDGLVVADDRIPVECEFSVTALAIDPTTPTTVYAAMLLCPVQLYAFPLLFKSTDGGAHWREVSRQFPPAESLIVDPKNPTTLYARSQSNKTSKSTDAGINWSVMNNGLSGYVNALILDPVDSTVLYVGTNEGVFKSIDSGASWQPLNKGLTHRTGPRPHIVSLAVDAEMPSRLYAGTGFAQAGGSGMFVFDQAEVCAGDCDGDGKVMVDEIISGIDIALGLAEVSACPNVDIDDDSAATVDEVVAAVDRALRGCIGGSPA